MFFDFFKRRVETNCLNSNGAKQDPKATILIPETGDTFVYSLTKKDVENKGVYFYKNGIEFEEKNIEGKKERFTRYIVSDGQKYDLCNPSDIVRFRIPQFAGLNGKFVDVTKDLTCYMLSHAKQMYDRNLAIPFVYTTVNLMIASPVGFTRADYMRMISQLERINENSYANYLKNEIIQFDKSLLDEEARKKNQAMNIIENSKDTDLVEIPYLGCACGECAKYQGRIYSVTGNDSRFPLLPDFIRETGRIHPGCSHYLLPAFGVETYITKYITMEDGSIKTVYVDPIINSNRPFVDDRNEYDKRRYISYKEKKEQDQRNREYMEDPERLRIYAKRRMEYEWIVENLSEIAPKSLGGYTRMKRANSKNYQRIKERALEMDMELDDEL